MTNPSLPPASGSWTFPLSLPKSRPRRLLKIGIGRLLGVMQPGLVRRLEEGFAPRNRNERCVLAGLVSRHRAAGTLDRLAAQHARFWESAAALRFHCVTETRFERVFLGVHHGIVDMLDATLAAGDIDTLCEIGCGSGRVLAYLAAREPALRRLVGIDLSAAQSALNGARYADPRLDFIGADALAWIPANARPGWAFLTYGGVLEYFPETALAQLFGAIANQAPACVALVEPLDVHFDLQSETRSRACGSELSFSHNYPRLLIGAGLRVVQQHECVHRGLRWLMLVART